MVGTMILADSGARALDYYPCQYGQSKLLFRGPRRPLKGRYCAVIGGSETYGKFVEKPFPALVERELGIPVVNFGCLNAGIDVFLNEPEILAACNRACAIVIQVPGAHNMSNRFYTVHPRRNDRFLHAAPALKALFHEIDFTEFHFTRHLLLTLKAIDAARYATVAAELKLAWVARMKLLLRGFGPPCILLCVGDYRSEGPEGADTLGPDPLLVDGAMLQKIAPHADDLVILSPSPAARAAGTEGMVFSDLDAPVAARMAGPRVQGEIAAALAPSVAALL